MASVTRLALVLLALAVCTPASAHRYCSRVDASGKLAGMVPDVNSQRPEFWVVEEATFMPSGERKRYVLYGGGSTPICSVEECERYMFAMGLNLEESPTMKLRAFCEEH